MDGLHLVKPSAEYEDQLLAYVKELYDATSTFDGTAGIRNFPSIKFWIKNLELYSSEETCPEGKVCATQFLLVDGGNTLLGMINIRHTLNEYLAKIGGHIGYNIRPKYRRMGYGKKMLAMALPYCRDTLDLDRVLVTCNSSNEASRRTILACGGIFDGTSFDEADGETVERYFINLR